MRIHVYTFAISLSFFIYACVAGALAAFTGKKMLEAWRLPNVVQDPMHIACRIGILLLTVGTLFDNSRTMFGTFDFIPVNNFLNVAAAWFCIANHQVIAAFTVFTPAYFVYSETKSVRIKYWIRNITAVCVGGLFVNSSLAFMSQQPNPLLIISECTEINAPYSTLTPTKKVPGSLICVFAYQFAMIGCGVYLVVKRQGCKLSTLRSWEFIFLIANFLCLPGQALLYSLGPYYKCYGSNFWEQVTFASAVFADYVLSEANYGRDSDVSPSESLSADYKPLTESLISGDHSDDVGAGPVAG